MSVNTEQGLTHCSTVRQLCNGWDPPQTDSHKATTACMDKGVQSQWSFQQIKLCNRIFFHSIFCVWVGFLNLKLTFLMYDHCFKSQNNGVQDSSNFPKKP